MGIVGSAQCRRLCFYNFLSTFLMRDVQQKKLSYLILYFSAKEDTECKTSFVYVAFF